MDFSSAAPKAALAIVVRVRTLLAAFDVGQVVETLRPLPVTPIAGAPVFVLGAAVIRGAVTPVVDAGALLVPDEPFSVPRRLVVIRGEHGPAAVAVDEVLGIRAMPSSAGARIPPLLGAAAQSNIASIGELDGRLLVVLETARLVPTDVWSALPAESARR